MLTTSTVSGATGSGAVHEVRIGRGFGDVRWIECASCGHRQFAQFGARGKADRHLASHGVNGAEAGPDSGSPEFTPLPWVLGFTTLLVLFVVMVAQSPGQ
ncbi:hypothetical protein PJ985_11805 [Streptomyces sp. ACA25]|uniref:hypothetical protein n=1 Tax=Streptomyces sp. ACA25 TaxID=3022596 RepID=UPI00230834F5|nr:hypothetical protein [Streptomyces sp. ACA25]MDB1088248.1 hypothetical protein [Streptomyces sp. ACA25]